MEIDLDSLHRSVQVNAQQAVFVIEDLQTPVRADVHQAMYARVEQDIILS